MTTTVRCPLGPVSHGLVVCADLDAANSAYVRHIGLMAAAPAVLTEPILALLGLPTTAALRTQLLCNPAGRPVVQLLELPQAPVPRPLSHHGWMALEILVADADASAARIRGQGFTLLRPAADLDVSDRIRACQVAGPSGEVLYLTQVKGQVPPFELPTAEHPIDRLFIPVLCTPDRAASTAFYQTLSGSTPLLFDTKITVVNQAHGLPLDTRHPVATLQLSGCTLVEIDELAMTTAAPATRGLAAGIAAVFFAHSAVETLSVAWQSAPRTVDLPGIGTCTAGFTRGAAGEGVVLFTAAT